MSHLYLELWFVYSSITNNVKVIYFLISMIPLWWRHASPSHAFSTSKWLVISSMQTNGEGLWLHAGGREANEWGHFINSFRAWFQCSNKPISGMPNTSNINTWVWWGEMRGIDTSYWNMPPHLGTILHGYHTPTYLLPITPYLPVVHSMWQGDVGIWGIPKDIFFQRHW